MSHQDKSGPAHVVCSDSDPAWLERRREGIGASDAPCIMGKSSFAGPARIAAFKLGLEVGVDHESELLKWGKRSEQPLIDWFQEETGIEATLDGSLWATNNAERSFMQATLDGTCWDKGETGGIECKLARFSGKEWETYGVPESVVIQTQHQMEVMGFGFTYVLVLLDGYRPRWSKIVRNDDFIEEEMVPCESEFWTKLMAGERIEPKGAPDGEFEALKAMYPEPDADSVTHLAGEKWVRVYEEWQAQSKFKTLAERRAKEARNELFAAMGPHEYATLDNGEKLSLKQQTRKETVVRESSFRVLRKVGK